MKINKKLIKELVSCQEENKLSELEYSEKDIKIKVARNSITDNNKIQVKQNTSETKAKENIPLKSWIKFFSFSRYPAIIVSVSDLVWKE